MKTGQRKWGVWAWRNRQQCWCRCLMECEGHRDGVPIVRVVDEQSSVPRRWIAGLCDRLRGLADSIEAVSGTKELA